MSRLKIVPKQKKSDDKKRAGTQMYVTGQVFVTTYSNFHVVKLGLFCDSIQIVHYHAHRTAELLQSKQVAAYFPTFNFPAKMFLFARFSRFSFDF